MTTFGPPIPVGQKSSNAVHAADLGNVYWIGSNAYRLVKSSGTITSPAKNILVTALSSGVPTWAVTTSTTANDYTVVGVVPSTLTVSLAAGDYFLIQVSGVATGTSAAAITLGAPIGTSATAGAMDDLSITSGVGEAGVCLATIAAGATDTPVLLKGLI